MEPTKSRSESIVEMVQLVLPNDVNLLENLKGGRLMHWIDIAAALTASKHSNHIVATVAMDSLDFQTSSREAEDVSTWKQNSFRSGARSFGHYATDYQYSCKKQHRAANHFPYGLGVHPFRVADLDGRICRIFEVQCQRVSEGSTSECKSILPSKAECEKTAKDDEDYYDCNDVSGCIKLHILFLLCFVFFADFVFYQGIEYLICGKRIPTEILPWIRS